MSEDERTLIKRVAAIQDRSMQSFLRVTVIRACLDAEEEALLKYEQGVRMRARRGSVPEAPLVPTDRLV